MEDYLDSLLSGERNAVLLLGTYYFAAMGLIGILNCFRLRLWPVTKGKMQKMTLERSGIASSGSDQNYIVDVSYFFEVKGKNYTGHRLSAWYLVASSNLRILLELQLKQVTYLDDGHVQIHFCPTKPSKSFLIVPGWKSIVFLMLITIGPSLACWYAQR